MTVTKKRVAPKAWVYSGCVNLSVLLAIVGRRASFRDEGFAMDSVVFFFVVVNVIIIKCG
jgi:hypothetical protein